MKSGNDLIYFAKYISGRCYAGGSREGELPVSGPTGGSYQIKIFLMSKRVFNMLRIVTYQDRMPKLYIVSTFFILVTIFWWVFKEKVLSGQKLEVGTK